MGSIKHILRNIFLYACRIFFGIDKKKVIMTSFHGKGYSDNPRAVSEKLYELAPNIKQVWLFTAPEKKQHIVPQYIKCVDSKKIFSYCREIATASVLISNFSLPILLKSKKQMFIQTWHGDKAFKKVLYDSPFAAMEKLAEEQVGYCDYAIAGSEYGEKQYRSAFRYKGTVLKCGTPRNDRLILQDAEEKKQIREKLNCAQGTRVLLYAPTLRREASNSRKRQSIQQLDLSRTLDQLEKRDGCKWQCFLRAHPAVVGLCGVKEDKRIVDVSNYEDMADLLLISDMLITDYSSCAGDFALTGRPIVLFQADRQEYLEKDRTFYFNMEDSPYFIAESQEELETILSQMTEEKAKENCKKILEFYGDCETGHASETVAKIIKDWIER